MKKLTFSHAVIFTLLTAWFSGMNTRAEAFQQQDTTRLKQDTIRNQVYKPNRKPSFRLSDRYGDPFTNRPQQSPFFLKDPTQVNMDVELDTNLNYTIYEKIGDVNYRPVSTMTFEEFNALQDRQLVKSYWQNKARSMDGESAVSGRGLIPKIFISPVLDRIFGGSYVELIPRGFVTLDFGGSWQRMHNPTWSIRQQKNGGFEFDQQINMSVVGKVGEKLMVSANFDNNNSFDFQNNMKVEYTGFKEDILKKLEIGNVGLPLNNTLIQGSQNLFGIKAQLQFGKLFVTAVASTQRGKVESINIPGGSKGQGREFEFIASDYDESRHFFLGHYFRDNYQDWIVNPVQLNSGINITRVEVYLMNRSTDTQTLRGIVAFADLGEANPEKINNPLHAASDDAELPNDNGSNDLYDYLTIDIDEDVRNNDRTVSILTNNGFVNGTDFELVTSARRLSETEFTVHKQLGYITLNRKLTSDETLAVAYEYTDALGRQNKVGELSEDYSALEDNQVVFLKMLRPRTYYPTDNTGQPLPMWDLMMKNIYSLNASQLEREGFQLRVTYRDDNSGIDNPQIQEGTYARNFQLIELMGLDRLNPLGDPPGDGNFDFFDGVTVNTNMGLIIFPYLEPFNKPLRDAFNNDQESNGDRLIQKYVFEELYRVTKIDASRLSNKNKFYIEGTYNASGGSSKDISIPGFGITPNSVRVYAGGTPLMEQTDFVVDYTMGKVTILNDAILNSGKDITVDYEQTDPFAFQTRTLLGTRFDYKLNEDINLGSTLLYYNERPVISRNAIGTEPARNVQYGFDVNVRKDSRLLTKWIDAIPGIQTKELSSFTWNAEFAQLLPGTSNVVDDTGTGYIDDFENTAQPYSLLNPTYWRLAATPHSGNFAGMGGQGVPGLEAGYRRGKLAWYQVDNQFYRDGGQFKPSNITDRDLLNHYVRGVGPQEIFPTRNLTVGNFFEQILDIAYYPNERGPYNYSYNLNGEGKFEQFDARNNWAGITTAIRTEVDFNKANIEYIEFWMMDPFIAGENGEIIDGSFDDNNTTGGKLIFHLGNVSEDVIPDSRHGFENGLPDDGDLNDAISVIETEWGYVTKLTYLNNAFDNTTSSRVNQDVGMDGMTNSTGPINEQEFFDSNGYLSTIATRLSSLGKMDTFKIDPSADDFEYFLSAKHDAARAQILERYKNINGMDRNSPVASSNDDIARSGSPFPDNEDLNADNTISELEAYYKYEIDLRPSEMVVGRQYIVDQFEASPKEHPEKVKWYLFRIPVKKHTGVEGNISGYNSIKYARMIMTQFQDPVVLRLANFRMVGAQWLRSPQNLREGGLAGEEDLDNDNIAISVVNIEEHSGGNSEKSPYLVPPGVIRDRDNTSSVARLLNEQSIQICIDDLEDGDAKAIFKDVSMDFFNYGRIKMFTHANSQLTNDDELVVFMRLGTDQNEHYYEVEIPLKISPIVANARERDVWPEENEFDFALDELYKLKTQRDLENFPLAIPYPLDGPRKNGRHGFRIVGRPDLTQVKVLMIGVRNPKSTDNRKHSVCLWANELRLTDFDRTSGWAVNTVLNAKLADFMTVSGSLRYTTFGFGSVNSKISERTRDETTAYDITANVNLDKLFLDRIGIKLPMLVSYENTTINPQYDPANPDIRLSGFLDNLPQEQRDAYRRLIRDREVRKSINFTNVRKVKTNTEAKTHIYDIENLALNYSYSEATRRSFTIDESVNRNYKGGIAYTFSPKETGIEPFKNTNWFKSPYLKLLKDFNLGLLPNNIMVRGDLERSFIKNVYRNSLSSSAPNYQKYFIFNRQYNVKWNLSRSLSLEYAARANAVIDEPTGEGAAVNEVLKENLKKFGRMKNFDQVVTGNYIFPLDKFPLTDWLSAEYRYQATYNWRAGPLYIPTDEFSRDFKNTIQNSRDRTFTGRIDMVKLYNKVTFLKDANTPPKPVTPVAKQQQVDTVRRAPPALNGFLRLLMAVREVNGTYSVIDGTILPGFSPSPYLFGMNKDFSAPGWDFILGSQNANIRYKAASKGWLTKEEELTNFFTQSRTRSLTMRAKVEPSSDLKVQLDIKKDVTDSYREIFRYTSDTDFENRDPISGFAPISPSRIGSYKISTISIRTAFNRTNDDKVSEVFQQFERNLDIVKGVFSTRHGLELDSASQDVTIAAFIAAYSGKNAASVNLSPFPNTPLPNWRVDYTGLEKIGALKNTFKAITISHGYSSSYSVLNYSNSLLYTDPNGVNIQVPIEDYNNGTYSSIIKDGKVVPMYVISQVMITEQFNPLIGINIQTKKRLTIRADYKTKRELSLYVSNAQITELSSKDVSLEVGYTKNNFKLPFKTKGRTIVLKNDVTMRLDFTVSDSKTIQRKIELPNTLTNGNVMFQLKPNIGYVVNQKLNIQIYYERTINEPVISNSYRRTTTRFGVQIRFNLAQ